MFNSGVAVLGHREIQLQIEASFGSGHEFKLVRGLDDPLPDLPITCAIHLDSLGIEVVRVALQDISGLIETADAFT
ncbi:MAG: hypothetical protein Ct9H300mP15_30340 [Gemmatimonadota bacterium]|nr:MAG: hypothetical protein Ct9H300mP15_30340 [Gemmatimonadota bacterium]